MPRIRTIKPEFWNDEKLGQEPEHIMLTYIGLWNFSDDYGVVKGNPTWLKNQIYPYKDNLRIGTFSTWLKRLQSLEVVILFSYRGESFYYIRNFRKHQKVDKPSQARNCPEDELTKIISNHLQEATGTNSGSSRGVVGEDYPLYIGREEDKYIGGDIPPPAYTPEQIKFFNEFQKWIAENAPDVNKMAYPLTIEQFLKLKEEFSSDVIADYLKRMHNWTGIKKNKSTYLTFKNWAERDAKK